MRRSVSLLLLTLVAGCAGPPSSVDVETRGAGALLDLWPALAAGRIALGPDAVSACSAPYGTWFENFGVRGLACSVAQGVPLATAARRSGQAVWTSGPHASADAGLALDLDAPRAFGHYHPAFVRWAVANAIPPTAEGVARTQPVYDRAVRRLARVYWLTHESLAVSGFPDRLAAGPVRAYAEYLDGGPIPTGAESYEGGGVSVFNLFDERSQAVARRMTKELASPGATMDTWNEWEVQYEANTAYGFWLRRRADGSHDAFYDGLRQLLAAYDPVWLRSNGG